MQEEFNFVISKSCLSKAREILIESHRHYRQYKFDGSYILNKRARFKRQQFMGVYHHRLYFILLFFIFYEKYHRGIHIYTDV